MLQLELGFTFVSALYSPAWESWRFLLSPGSYGIAAGWRCVRDCGCVIPPPRTEEEFPFLGKQRPLRLINSTSHSLSLVMQERCMKCWKFLPKSRFHEYKRS